MSLIIKLFHTPLNSIYKISRTLGHLWQHASDRRIRPKLRHNRSSCWYLLTLDLRLNLSFRLLPNGYW